MMDDDDGLNIQDCILIQTIFRPKFHKGSLNIKDPKVPFGNFVVQLLLL